MKIINIKLYPTLVLIEHFHFQWPRSCFKVTAGVKQFNLKVVLLVLSSLNFVRLSNTWTRLPILSCILVSNCNYVYDIYQAVHVHSRVGDLVVVLFLAFYFVYLRAKSFTLQSGNPPSRHVCQWRFLCVREAMFGTKERDLGTSFYVVVQFLVIHFSSVF